MYLLREFDEHFSWSSQIVLGIFSTRKKALAAARKRYSEKYDLTPNGDEQWWIEKVDADSRVGGLMITEMEVNKIDEW